MTPVIYAKVQFNSLVTDVAPYKVADVVSH